MSFSAWRYAVAVTCVLTTVSVQQANAQVCGDADGNGSVTVSDGVQALRAAAGLSSTCDSDCDVDGSGGVTVTDGVNILRAAAELPVTLNCGGLANSVESLLNSQLPLFGALTKFAGVAGGATAAGSQDICENVDGDVVFNPDTGETTFFNCLLGGIIFDGSIGSSASTVDIDLTLIDVTTGDEQTFSGSLTPRQSGENFIISGFIDLSSPFGDFEVDFNELVTDPSGFFIGGSLEFGVFDAELPDVDLIRLNFAPSDIALVEVVLVDEEIIPFNFNTVTGELTPVSN